MWTAAFWMLILHYCLVSRYCGSWVLNSTIDTKFTSGEYPKHDVALVMLAGTRDIHYLIDALRSVYVNLLPNNPADVLVFHAGEFDSEPKRTALLQALPQVDVLFLLVPHEFWQVPDNVVVSEKDSWHFGNSISYRHMCRWYSVGMFPYVSKAGYHWVMRMDDDSIFHSEITFNMVSTMVSLNQIYGFRLGQTDNLKVVWSLPELTAFYIKSEKIVPTWLFKHCTPSNSSGLNSNGGWTRFAFFNNFFITKVDFWMHKKVRKYLKLVDSTGGIYKFRWGDGPIHTMVLGMLAQESQLVKFNFDYTHGFRYTKDKCNGSVFEVCLECKRL